MTNSTYFTCGSPCISYCQEANNYYCNSQNALTVLSADSISCACYYYNYQYDIALTIGVIFEPIWFFFQLLFLLLGLITFKKSSCAKEGSCCGMIIHNNNNNKI